VSEKRSSNLEKWQHKVTVTALQRPWWRSDATKAVATVDLAGVLTFDCMVVEGRNGHHFVSMPSRKRDDRWEAIVTLRNEALKYAVTEAVLVAFANWQPAGEEQPTPEAAIDDLPF
jgi:DNA-binding cell septation regulator SpoVG